MKIRLFFLFLLFGTQLLVAQQNEALAFEFLQQKEYEKAAELLQKLYKNQPTEKNYQALLTCYVQLKNYDGAEKLASKQFKITKDPAYQIDLGTVYNSAGKEKKAKDVFEEVIKNLGAHSNEIIKLGGKFYQVKAYDYAIETYEKGRKLLKGQYSFSFEIAEVYNARGDFSKMAEEILSVLQYGESYLEGVKSAISTQLSGDIEGKKRTVFKDQTLIVVQRNPNDVAYTELLIWLYLEEGNYSSAFIFSKALDKRNNESGSRIMQLAKVCRQNYEYTTAEKCYQYVIEKGSASYFQQSARLELVNLLREKLEQSPVKNPVDIANLEKVYIETLKDVGKNPYTIELIRGYANFLAFYKGEPTKGIALLEEALTIPGLSQSEIALSKLALGDIYVYQNDVWEAILFFGQVNQDFKDDVIGFEAKLRSAKAYYYTGNFDWAKSNLDVLKAATSKLIANDALQLSVLISDNLGMDTSAAALQAFAHADLLYYQGNRDSALYLLNQVLVKFPEHLSLLDEVYFLRGKIYTQKLQWELAIQEYEKAVDYKDLLVDDALLELAKIYDNVLLQPDKAITFYEKLIVDFPGSVYTVQARQRYRILRGDILN